MGALDSLVGEELGADLRSALAGLGEDDRELLRVFYANRARIIIEKIDELRERYST